MLKNQEEVAQLACQRILDAAAQAIKKNKMFHIVLAGGTTPEKTYEILSRQSADWKYWHIWFGDERCLPENHPDRNSQMVERALTSKVPIPAAQIYIIPAEQGPEAAAEYYTRLLEGIRVFDMVLLGMGEDGHTASLFPDQHHMQGKVVLPIFDAPKLPHERVSLSAEMLSRSRKLIFIITGQSKSKAVSRWRSGEKLPVSSVNGIEKTEVLIDQSAL